MNRKIIMFSLVMIVSVALGVLAQLPAGSHTRLVLTEKSPGRRIFSVVRFIGRFYAGASIPGASISDVRGYDSVPSFK